MSVTLDDQIKAVRRELALRQRVYPRWTAQGKMKQADADRELAAMQAVHDTISAIRKPTPELATMIAMHLAGVRKEIWASGVGSATNQSYIDRAYALMGFIAEALTTKGES